MFKKKLKLKSFSEAVDVDTKNTNGKNDGPSYYPETQRGREFFDAHTKASPVIDKTGAPETQFKSNLKKIDDHGPPKVDSFAGDPHSNSAIAAVRSAMLPRVKTVKEQVEFTKEEFEQLDEGVRMEHCKRHHARAVVAAQEALQHLNTHGKQLNDPKFDPNHYYDDYQIKEVANQLENSALSIGTHVENRQRQIDMRNKENSPRVMESVNEQYVSSSRTIRELLRKK